MKTHAAFLLAAGALVSASAFAQQAPLPGQFFIKGSAGQARTDANIPDDSSSIYMLTAGYRWEVSAGSAIGIEAGYGDFGTFGTVATITNIEPLPGASSDTESAPYRIKLKGPKLGLNGAFQFADAWQFHLRGGWFRANTKSSAYFPLNDFHLRRSEQQNGHYLGAGISRNFGPQWSAGIDYDYYSVGGRRERDRNADYAVKALTASAEYRF